MIKIIIKNNHKRGFVLIAVLWLTVLLLATVALTARKVSLDMRLSIAAGQQVAGKWACRAGLQQAMQMLADDKNGSDGPTDKWAEIGDDEQGHKLEIDGFEIFFTISDSSARLNINKLEKEQLLQLPQMTAAIADAILDWRDKDSLARTEGAENDYYQALSPPYKASNSDFKTLNELLAVKGINHKLLLGQGSDEQEKQKAWCNYLTCFSSSNNQDSQHQARININTASEADMVNKLDIKAANAKWIMENRKDGFGSISALLVEASGQSNQESQPLDSETFRQIADKITVSDDKQFYGRVNFNTANAEILQIVIGAENKTLTDNLIAYRQSSGAVDNISDLLDADAMTMEIFKKIADQLVLRSNIFQVHCRAVSKLNQSEYNLTAIVDRSGQQMEILYWFQN